MDSSTVLKVRLEEIKERRRRLLTEPRDYEGMTQEQRDEVNSNLENKVNVLNAQYDETFTKWKVACSEEQTQPGNVVPTADVSTKNKELYKVRQHVSLGRYIAHAHARTDLKGAEREYSQALLGDSHNQIQTIENGPTIPPEFFVYTPEEHKDLREYSLTDLTASADTADENRNETLRRLFHGSVAEFLRVSYRNVPSGAQTFPTFSTGASPSTISATVAKSAAIAATNTAITAETVKPERFGAAYDVHFEDEALLGGVVGLHAEDLARTLRSGLDYKAVGKIETSISNPAVPSAEAVLADYVGIPFDEMDGIYAEGTSDVSLLMPTAIFAHAGKIPSTKTDRNVIDLLAMRGTNSRATAKLPAPDASGARQDVGEIIVIKANGEGPVAPVWGGVNLITDRVSKARSGNVELTVWMFMNLVVRRSGVFDKVAIKVA